MPLGNGLMGAMVFGGTERERVALNESSFWTGRPHDSDNPEALKHLSQIRDLVFAGKLQEAEKMADAHFFGVLANQQAYSTLGDLVLSFESVEKADEYRRELDMETGVAKVRYRAGDMVLTREAFTSYVNYHDTSADPAARCEKVLAGIEGKDYPTLRRRHEEDLRRLMGRVYLAIGDPSANDKPIDERLKAMREGAADLNLEALCSSSAATSLPPAAARAGSPPTSRASGTNQSRRPGAASTPSTSTPRWTTGRPRSARVPRGLREQASKLSTQGPTRL